ncbi:MAG: type II toxin-antitoxin system ParD family antitoxin [Planctomycetaceae bacterium]|nr:type II toxin-antitoxin system ParD family antitoxin [Planctomycetaceae bacterium]
MPVQITPESEHIVQSMIAAGAYETESAVIEEALRLLQQREQLRAEIQQGIEELDRGERIPAEVVFQELRARFGNAAR